MDMKRRNYKTFASIPPCPSSMPPIRRWPHTCARSAVSGFGRPVSTGGASTWPMRSIRTSGGSSRRDQAEQRPDDAAIIGEIWGDSHLWLGGDMFDSVMHYPAFPVKDFFARGTMGARPNSTAASSATCTMYAHPVRDALWTMLDTHDTERFFTATGEDAEATRLAAFLRLPFPARRWSTMVQRSA